MPVGNGWLLEVTIQSTMFSQKLMTILHYAVTATPTQTDPLQSEQDLLALINAGGTFDLVTPYLAACANNLTLQDITTQYIWPTRYVRKTAHVGTNGTVADAARTANTSTMIEKIGDQSGRKYRGAIHLPGTPPGNVGNGVIDATQQVRNLNVANACKTQLAENLGTGLWNAAIVHRGKPLPGTWAPWLSSVIQTTARVQRRRTVGLGI